MRMRRRRRRTRRKRRRNEEEEEEEKRGGGGGAGRETVERIVETRLLTGLVRIRSHRIAEIELARLHCLLTMQALRLKLGVRCF